MLNARKGKTKTMIRFLLFEQLLYFYAVASSLFFGTKNLCFACVLLTDDFGAVSNKERRRLHAVYIHLERSKGNIFGELLHAYVIVC